MKETTATTGVGARVLAGAASGCRAFGAVCGDTDLVNYACAGGAEFEVGVGRYNSGANSITPLEIIASSNAGAVVNFSAGSKDIFITQVADQANYRSYLSYLTDLQAWYSADHPGNTNNANTPPETTTFFDRSGNGRHVAQVSGALQRWDNLLNRTPIWEFPYTGGGYVANTTLPIQGGLTFFAVMKMRSANTYQCFFERYDALPSTLNVPYLNLFYDQPANGVQVSGTLAANTAAAVVDKWVTLLIHFYNSSGNTRYNIRVNGVQTTDAQGNGNAAGNPFLGTSSVPVSINMSLFNRITGQHPCRSPIAEFGFYGASKLGIEGPIEAYLRQKYATW